MSSIQVPVPLINSRAARNCSSFFILQIEMKTCAYLPEPHCINPFWIVLPLALILVLVIVCDDDPVE